MFERIKYFPEFPPDSPILDEQQEINHPVRINAVRPFTHALPFLPNRFLSVIQLSLPKDNAASQLPPFLQSFFPAGTRSAIPGHVRSQSHVTRAQPLTPALPLPTATPPLGTDSSLNQGSLQSSCS